MKTEKTGAGAAEVPVEDLRITAALAHLNVDDAELAAALPAFRDMLSYFAAMQAADADTKAFGAGLAGFSFSGECAGAARFRSDAPGAETAEDLTGAMLDNSGERDGRFIVVPNVL
ncbi:MAG: aspartyl/glutamyl-tRNA amidotransferase subunit C [Spirochaetaceae bacterium]|jgi:aspartyl-tRNA(Asn)/glutamyl-tRNA(Gln) amidotransferase subunit C|nr:aspartyl/glutamyl-tRNA amidotransferase subunit C [Spirochaetaceae bacterium]